MKRAGILGLVCALALGAASCGEAVRGIDEQRKIIDIINGAEPYTLDPQKSTGQWESNIIGNMFIGLTTEDAKGETIPGMAKSWEVSPDGLSWVFLLRNAQWSDGQPVTAYDFEYAFRRILNPETHAEYASLLYPILNAEKVNNDELPPSEVGVRALDEKTLEIRLEYPTPYLPQLLTHQTSFPIPKHVVERYGDDWIKPANVEVNGPFKLVKWWSNYLVHIKKNPGFYDAKSVCLNDIYFYPITDNEAAVRGFRRGEYAWSTRFPTDRIDQIRKEFPKETHTAPFLVSTYLSVNMTKPPLNDVRVRTALAMAIDREFIVKEIVKVGEPSYQFVPPGMPGYAPAAVSWKNETLKARRAKAKQLLQEAGFGPDKPLSLSFSYRSSNSGKPGASVAIQGDWQEIAPWVKIELRPSETQVHYTNLRTKNFEIGDGGWVADYVDPQNYLYLLQTNAGSQNYPGYSSPEYDSLMAQANREQDKTVRLSLMHQAEQIMLNDLPIMPLFIGASTNLVDTRLTGFEDNLSDVHRARWMCIKGK